MLPVKNDFSKTGNLGGESIKMSFDQDSLDFLAEVVINLYSDKELAVIREYSTNALDSHKQAGQTEPIEITTPTSLYPFFRIKDYGVGLSRADIENIYSKYGASTKRNTNDQVGMLGLGCKSALTYTNQFTLKCVKDGVKINVAVSREETGGATMSILSEVETTDANGVEVIIPTLRNNDFRDKCYKFFRFWNNEDYLLDGSTVRAPDVMKISDRISILESPGYRDKAYVIMGGVSYEIDLDKFNLPNGFIAFVGMGEVIFTPNREQLHYTKTTIDTLTALREEYVANASKAVQEAIDACETKLEAITTFNNWNKTLGKYDITLACSDFTYKGNELQIKFNFDAHYERNRKFTHTNEQKGYSYRYGRMFDVPFWKMNSANIVTGFDADTITPYQRKKLLLWSEGNSGKDTFYFCDKISNEFWLEDVSKVEWETILAIKINRAGGPKQAVTKPTYDYYLNGSYLSTTDLDTKLPIWYSTKAEFNNLTEHKMEKRAGALKDVQCVFVGANRVDKFLRKYPNAVKFKEGLTQHVTDYLDGLTDKKISYIKSDYWSRQRFSQLDASKLVDPDLVVMVSLGDQDTEVEDEQALWTDYNRIAYDLGLQGRFYSLKNDAVKGHSETIYDRYPLLSSLLTASFDDKRRPEFWPQVYQYLNQRYNELV